MKQKVNNPFIIPLAVSKVDTTVLSTVLSEWNSEYSKKDSKLPFKLCFTSECKKSGPDLSSAKGRKHLSHLQNMTARCGTFIHYDIWKLLLSLAWISTVLLQLNVHKHKG